MLETLLMTLMRLTGGRVAEVFLAIGYEGSARICTFSHPIAWFVGMELGPDAPHIHVKLRLWSKGGHATTVLSIDGGRMREEMALGWQRQPSAQVLQPSGQPADFEFTLRPRPPHTRLAYAPGDKLPVDLHMSRGWVKKIDLPVVAEKQAAD